MPFKRRALPTAQNYITKEEHDAKIAELEQKISAVEQSVTVTIEKFDFPDWTKLTALNENEVYRFDTNGYLLVGMRGGNGDRWIETSINGQTIRWLGDSGSYKYGWGCMQVYLPIRKGVSFYFCVNHRNQSVAFAYFLGC